MSEDELDLAIEALKIISSSKRGINSEENERQPIPLDDDMNHHSGLLEEY